MPSKLTELDFKCKNFTSVSIIEKRKKRFYLKIQLSRFKRSSKLKFVELVIAIIANVLTKVISRKRHMYE